MRSRTLLQLLLTLGAGIVLPACESQPSIEAAPAAAPEPKRVGAFFEEGIRVQFYPRDFATAQAADLLPMLWIDDPGSPLESLFSDLQKRLRLRRAEDGSDVAGQVVVCRYNAAWYPGNVKGDKDHPACKKVPSEQLSQVIFVPEAPLPKGWYEMVVAPGDEVFSDDALGASHTLTFFEPYGPVRSKEGWVASRFAVGSAPRWTEVSLSWYAGGNEGKGVLNFQLGFTEPVSVVDLKRFVRLIAPSGAHCELAERPKDAYPFSPGVDGDCEGGFPEDVSGKWQVTLAPGIKAESGEAMLVHPGLDAFALDVDCSQFLISPTACYFHFR